MTDKTTGTIGLAMKSKSDAERLARDVRGKRRYEAPDVSYECPEPAVMTARIEPSSPETTAAGYPFTLVIGCRVPTRMKGFRHCDAFRHCDEYIDDPATPEALRKFLAFARAPAHGQLLPEPHPTLYADHAGTRVRVTMASRLGDVGITTNFGTEMGYERRVPVSQLSNFSEEP